MHRFLKISGCLATILTLSLLFLFPSLAQASVTKVTLSVDEPYLPKGETAHFHATCTVGAGEQNESVDWMIDYGEGSGWEETSYHDQNINFDHTYSTVGISSATVKCKLTRDETWTESNSCQVTVYTPIPDSLSLVDAYTIQYEDEQGRIYRYQTHLKYQVIDQHGQAIAKSGMSVMESITPWCTKYGGQSSYLSSTNTDALGQFSDVLYAEWDPFIPDDYLAKQNQVIYVDSYEVGTYCQTFYNDHAQAIPGMCYGDCE